MQMDMPEEDAELTILIPVNNEQIMGMLREHNNGLEVELSKEQWWQVWCAQYTYEGHQTLEVVESIGPVCNMGS